MIFRKSLETIREADWRWPSFTPTEMACSVTGRLIYDEDFMDWLQAVRYIHGEPMIITSGGRAPEHQQLLPGGRMTGSHVDGMAVDVKVSGAGAYRLVNVAMSMETPALGVGVHQTGRHDSRYIHLDRWTTSHGSTHRPALWSY